MVPENIPACHLSPTLSDGNDAGDAKKMDSSKFKRSRVVVVHQDIYGVTPFIVTGAPLAWLVPPTPPSKSSKVALERGGQLPARLSKTARVKEGFSYGTPNWYVFFRRVVVKGCV